MEYFHYFHHNSDMVNNPPAAQDHLGHQPFHHWRRFHILIIVLGVLASLTFLNVKHEVLSVDAAYNNYASSDGTWSKSTLGFVTNRNNVTKGFDRHGERLSRMPLVGRGNVQHSHHDRDNYFSGRNYSSHSLPSVNNSSEVVSSMLLTAISSSNPTTRPSSKPMDKPTNATKPKFSSTMTSTTNATNQNQNNHTANSKSNSKNDPLDLEPMIKLYFDIKPLPTEERLQIIERLSPENQQKIANVHKIISESEQQSKRVEDRWMKVQERRPERNVQGEKLNRWWYVGMAGRRDDSYLEKMKYWWRDSDSCFDVDHICQYHLETDPSGENAEWKWFYYTPPSGENVSSYHNLLAYLLHENNTANSTNYDFIMTKAIFQPTMELKSAPVAYVDEAYADQTISIVVESSSRLTSDDMMYFLHRNDTWFEFSPQRLLRDDDRYHRRLTSRRLTQYHYLRNQHRHRRRRLANHTDNPQNTIDDKATCRILPTQNYLAVQSLYNGMMAEFYGRTIMKLFLLMTRHIDHVSSNNTYLENGNETGKDNKVTYPWEQDIQFLVHLTYGNKQLLDGHKLLLSGLSTSKKARDTMSFADVFRPPNQDGNSTGEGTSASTCNCYKKITFCGYGVHIQPMDREKARHNNVTSSFSNENDNNQTSSSSLSPVVVPPEVEFDLVKTISESHVNYTLWPTQAVDQSNDPYCDHPAHDPSKCQQWDLLRKFISKNHERNYPRLHELVLHHRKGILLQRGWISRDYAGDTKEWIFVGLSQRTIRRSWLNLDQVIAECDRNFSLDNNSTLMPTKVICTEVNIEKTSTPLEQLVLHRSMNVLIGVHGSQMTQAILLPKHSHVLELMPWIPPYIGVPTICHIIPPSGTWTNARDSPTPALGTTYHNTDLNHIGYPLDRWSVPLCEEVSKHPRNLSNVEEEEKECFTSQENINKFLQLKRDFVIDPKIVIEYLSRFVLFWEHDDMRFCDVLKDRLDDDYVLFNIWCSDIDAGGNGTIDALSARHYYQVKAEDGSFHKAE